MSQSKVLSETLFQRRPSVLFRAFDGFVLLAIPGEEDFKELSGAGSVIWALLGTPRSIAEIARTLANQYATPVREITLQVEALVTELVRLGSVGEVAGRGE